MMIDNEIGCYTKQKTKTNKKKAYLVWQKRRVHLLDDVSYRRCSDCKLPQDDVCNRCYIPGPKAISLTRDVADLLDWIQVDYVLRRA